MLELPPPAIDALGRPAWSVAPSDVSKAYRKLSILVHPDKNPGEEARQAFEALNQAHRLLKDPGELETILKDHLDQAKARREEAEAKATLDERVLLKAQHKEEAKQLRKQEGEALHAEVLRQMREKQERAKRRREAASKYKRARDADSSLLDEDDGDDDEEGDQGGHGDEAGSDSDVEAAQRQRQALAKRRQRQKKMAAL